MRSLYVTLAVFISAVAAFGLVTATAQHPNSAIILNQGWSDATRLRFYHEPQGTMFVPAALLEALQTPDGSRLMARENLERVGFIFDTRAAAGNPYGWPIGVSVDKGQFTGGVQMAAFSCSACHTAQVQYRGTQLRIDGGPANVDFAAFVRLLHKSIVTTGAIPARRTAFIARAVALGYPRSRAGSDFESAYQRALQFKHEPLSWYIPGGPGRFDALAGIANNVLADGLMVPSNALKGTAPVNYPYLWNITNFDWVQYNASVHQPMGRNVGEALGVGALTHFVDPRTGKLSPEPERWRTSVDVRNIHWMENALATLQPPPWPQNILGPIDRARAARGHLLFTQMCSSCHGVRQLAGTDDPTVWAMRVVPLNRIGTDPNQAVNFARGRYDLSKLGQGRKSTVDALVYITTRVKEQAYIDAGIPRREWPAFDGFGRPMLGAAPCGYKARPLVGAWATGPFLHNGSVPSIYDLLSETRPAKFWVGSREFDPKKLGFAQVPGVNTMLYDTSVTGNSNAGHWFTNDEKRPGRIGRALREDEKYAIIEYLKAATFADYPATTVAHANPMPCQDRKEWAQ